jgi:Na+/H+-dicarboxylate symporter
MSYSVTGTFCIGVTGATGAAVSVLSMILESVSLNVPVKLKLDNNINAISIVANVQVLLSKSQLFLNSTQHLRTAYSR